MSSKNKIILAVVAVLAIAAIIALGIRNQMQKQPDDENVIKIGAILPLTGEASYLGSEIQKGMECQRKLYEEQGVKIEIVYQDSMYSAKGGIAAYQALKSKYHSQSMIVAGSAVANAVTEYAQNEKQNATTLVGILVSSERSSEKNNNFYRCWPSGNDEAKIMGKYLKQLGDSKKIGILYQNDELGLDGKDAFVKCAESLGLEIVFEESVSKSLTDAESIAGKLLHYSVDKVYCIGSTPGIGLVVKALKAHAYSAGFLFTSTLDVANLRNIIGNSAIHGILYTSMFIPQDTEGDKTVSDYSRFNEFLSEEGTKPNMLNVYGAVSVSFGKTVSQKGNSTSIQSIETIIGELQLNNRHGIDFPMYIKKADSVQLGNDTILEVVMP